MGQLRAILLDGGPDFVTELGRAWDAGDAVLPLDPRSPPKVHDRVMAALRPHRLITADGTHSRADGIDTDPDDALVVATSGTTGEPKGVVLTHEAIRASAEATSEALAVDDEADRWLACLPLAHIGGLSVITRALHTGVEVEVHDGFDPEAVERARDRGASLVSLVPAVLHRLDVTGFRRVLLGGSAIPADRPDNCVATYGMTETGSGIVYDGFALPGVELRVIDDEIEVRGPMLLRCYRDGTDPREPDGWFRTGDAGALAADGRLTVWGRTGDLIITGGENVWPVAVEEVLRTHPAIAEVLVAGRPDSEWGQRIVARVIPVDPATPPALDALRDHVKAELPGYCAPRALELVDSLPLTPLGKVARHPID